MTWQPGQPLITADDHMRWEAWKRTSKLEAQRWRRQRYRRIDYFPSKAAETAIDALAHSRCAGGYTAALDELVLAGAEAMRPRARRPPE